MVLNRRQVLAATAVGLVSAVPSFAADIIQEGDIVVETLSNTTATLESKQGSVTIRKRIDQHSNLTIRAAKDVTIGEKIDQHSSANITAGGSVTIGQKIDQHSIARITAQNIHIGEKVDQHSVAFLSAPNGTLAIDQGVSGTSVVHYLAKTARIGHVDDNCTVDMNMNAPVGPDQGPNS